MLVSVIIPACAAQATLPQAIQSLIGQTHGDWEAIIVSDDGTDYLAHLASQGFADARVRMVSTGGVRTGCHHARNVGLRVANGDFITQLDADDIAMPFRLAQLLPLAARHGAAADNLMLRDSVSGQILYCAMGRMDEPTFLRPDEVIALTTPLVPLVRRDHVLAREAGVEMAEDVIANLQLMARIGTMPVAAQSSYIYNIHSTSICHEPGAEMRFDTAYDDYIARLEHGDGFGLSPALRETARTGFQQKRALNLAYARATQAGYVGLFQHFAQDWRNGEPRRSRNSQPGRAFAVKAFG